MSFDPRFLSSSVYDALSELRQNNEGNERLLRDQRNQAIELYTYLATWGMMRLKAEEKALSQDGKKQVVKKYFLCLQNISDVQNLANDQGLETLKNMNSDDYLGITGLGLELANEFSFWANAIYSEIK